MLSNTKLAKQFQLVRRCRYVHIRVVSNRIAFRAIGTASGDHVQVTIALFPGCPPIVFIGL